PLDGSGAQPAQARLYRRRIVLGLRGAGRRRRGGHGDRWHQAGSIRIPASHCGIVGLKPTFGLVPYTGIGLLEITIDTCGPMTANVRENALLLEVIAGPDGL